MSDVEEIVDRVARVVEGVFEELSLPAGAGRAKLKRKEMESARIEWKRLPNGITRAFKSSREEA